MMIRVAIIGAGAAGLCALRHLLDHPTVFDPVVFEMADGVGGTWIFTNQTGQDKNGRSINSSMYKNLRTNIPKEVMAFPDFPFDSRLPSFVSHEEVLKYLEDYSCHFKLLSHIKFKTIVERVHPVRNQTTQKVTWHLTYHDVNDPGAKINQEFDGVIVCSGHFSVPLMPDIPGMRNFKGQQLHSHNYREPRGFRDKKVVCLGAGYSGTDIAIEISKVAKEVILSHNRPRITSVFPSNIKQKQGISSIEASSVVFRDGSRYHADVIMYCTGYRYYFNFLSEDCNLNIDKHQRITPLYKHVVHTEFPSLSFIGLCKSICPFPFFHIQCQFVLGVLDGTIRLPSRKEMDVDTDEDFKSRLLEGLPPRYAHHMGPRVWDYMSELVNMADIKPVCNIIHKIYTFVEETRETIPLEYKDLNYAITGPDTFRVLT